MIERGIIKKKLNEFKILEHIAEVLDRPGYSHTTIQKTPLGEKITIYTSKPGFIVGRKGANIKDLTQVLKDKFGLENPQVEVSEIDNPNLNPHSVAKHIVHTFERFGPSRFKFLGYKMLENIMAAGAIGAEIVISGRGVPSTRSKTWRFTAGHLKKSGDVSENLIKKGFAVAHLKSGSIGVKVNILTPDIELPDHIEFRETITVEEVKEEPKVQEESEKKEIQKKETKEETPKEEETKAEEKIEKKESDSKEEEKKPAAKKKTTKKKTEKVPTAAELKKKKENGDNKKE